VNSANIAELNENPGKLIALFYGAWDMPVWEITNKWMNDVAAVGPDPRSEFDPDNNVAFWKQFEGDSVGSALQWSHRPKLIICKESDRAKPLPRADISPFTAPGLVINEKARHALGDILGLFGQILEIEVAGQTEYYYNVINVIACLDREHAQTSGAYVEVPVFHKHLVPESLTIFVEPTMFGRIFVNEGAKTQLDERIAANQLVGMSFKAW
jgi:hypothetical protein